jgi:hypothetical protein
MQLLLCSISLIYEFTKAEIRHSRGNSYFNAVRFVVILLALLYVVLPVSEIILLVLCISDLMLT